MATGLFKIFIKWNDEQIYGSPFETRVINPSRIRLLESYRENSKYKILTANANQEKIISLETKEAGPGELQSLIIKSLKQRLKLFCFKLGELSAVITSNKYERIPFKRIVQESCEKISFIPPYEGLTFF